MTNQYVKAARQDDLSNLTDEMIVRSRSIVDLGTQHISMVDQKRGIVVIGRIWNGGMVVNFWVLFNMRRLPDQMINLI